MKRILALCALGLACSSAMATTGLIDFEGTVRAGGTCPISVVNPGGSPLPIINFGNFETKDYTSAGQQTEMKKFALRLDPATCTETIPAETTVTFNANYTGPTPKLYGLKTGVGYSEGFAIAIYDSSGQLDPNTPSAKYPLDDTVPTEMIFNTNLHTTKPVTEGTIASSISFVVAIP
ncbi:fimbrial protein [Pseudomonas sp. NPDC089428]|uniref:fimbrial protein n=1 Tax=Pseudomonas sp. NPDC089428 TaxID=3364467 RepID=UPI0038112256